MILVSDADARRLLALHRRGDDGVEFAPDLGRTPQHWRREIDGYRAGEQRLSLALLETAAAGRDRIFAEDEGGIRALELCGPPYLKLMPTAAGIPTMQRDGIQMHRTTGIDPAGDTREKTRGLIRPGARVFDTCTGLGYTALDAVRLGASFVLSVERDGRVYRLMQWNPWSRDFFCTPVIHPLQGDSAELAAALPTGCFDVVIHDPPRFALAGALYGAEFYGQLYRLLRRGGQLYHYIGKPGSASGDRVTTGVLRRLRAAGFQTRLAPERFGILARRG